MGGGTMEDSQEPIIIPTLRPLGFPKLTPSTYQVGQKQGRKWRDS